MAISETILDDLRFQKDLVDEARRRIIYYCPEWTEYNVSDPGITLIELFAWMTELIVYRLNRVPDKIYIKLLELLGIQLQPASSAKTELTFWLSTPFPISPGDDTYTVVPQGIEVATRRTEEEPEVIFTTDKRLAIIPPTLRYVYGAQEVQTNYQSWLGKDEFHPFRETPQTGDTFYLGFEETQDLSGHILQLEFHCKATEGVGISRENPPLVWACSTGEGQWQEVTPSRRPHEEDTTGGFNDTGKVVLDLPLAMKPDEVYGRRAYWVRCRFEHRRDRERQGSYTKSPHITNIIPHTLGATVPATQAVMVKHEILGQSNGEPGQVFHLEHAPVLALNSIETVEVEEKVNGEASFVAWQPVEDFTNSDEFERHFSLETRNGEVSFGPNIRQRDGVMRQYGKVPPANHTVRFTQYRYGGGVIGNVPAEKLQVLKTSIPYVDRVKNLSRAAGGQDPESLEEAKLRTRRELRAQDRAVTATDYEDLAKRATRAVARVKCNTPQHSSGQLLPGLVEILVVPAVTDALREGDLTQLHLKEEMIQEIKNYLDRYRMLTTVLQVREPAYIGIKVTAEIVPYDQTQADLVKSRVVEQLKNFINGLNLNKSQDRWDELMGPNWEGWPFGRNLYVAEIFSLIQRTPGVKHVLDVQLSQRPVIPCEEGKQGKDDSEERLTPVTEKWIEVKADTLLCSLEHEVKILGLVHA